MTKQRVEWIDAAKGILILLVVFGHLNAKWFPRLDGTIKWIYTFHMIAFFMLSGMVFNAKNNFKIFFLSKCKTLLVPYVIFSVLGLFGAVKQFLNNEDFFDLAANVGRTYLYGEGMWFLCSLFIVEIVAYFLDKIEDKKYKGLILMGLIFIGGGYYEYVGVELPFKCDVSIYAIAGFYVGMLLKPYIKKSVSQNKISPGLLLGFIGSVLISVLYYSRQPEISLRIEHVALPWYWLAAMFGMLWVYCMAVSVCDSFLKNAFIYIGKNSLIFYCLNDAVLKVLKGVFFVILKIDLTGAGFIKSFAFGIIFVVITIIIIIPFVEIINKHLSFIIGR